MSKTPILLSLPTGFKRYPRPGSNSALEGYFQVDLGWWLVGQAEERQLVLTIRGTELPKLAAAVAASRHEERNYGVNALQVFFGVNEAKESAP